MNGAALAMPQRFTRVHQRLGDYLELTKPRITALVLVTMAAGYWLGLRAPGHLALIWPVLIGTALSAAGANTLNQVMERVPDGLMRRTQRRPVPAGRLQAEDARRFGLALSGLGVAFLTLAVNGLAGGLAAVAIASYLALYTPLKRRTPLCTLVGAIPGAIPPMIGWAAARHGLDGGAWALFGILFLWQLPHFLAIAVLYRDDYARAGFKMLPLTEPHGGMAARQTALYGLALLPVSLTPTMLGLTGEGYFIGTLVLGTAFLVMCARAALARSLPACRALFLASLLYLPMLLALLAWDKRPGL